jgi:AcrR family transcriptional regulator
VQKKKNKQKNKKKKKARRKKRVVAAPAFPSGAADRRREILDAAFAVIAERGLEGLRTRDIAARAGANIASLHYHFGSKDELIAAVVEHTTQKFVADQMRSFPADGVLTLKTHFASARKSFVDDPALFTVLQELSLRAQRDDGVRRAFRAIHDNWNVLVEGILRAGVERGELRRDLDVKLSARIVTASVIGASIELGVNPAAFDFARFADELTRGFAA